MFFQKFEDVSASYAKGYHSPNVGKWIVHVKNRNRKIPYIIGVFSW